ncbi:hypothetical protein Taro_048081 [Colocasia esculenta]|uniref:Uncharacterized protein n=1 Tax=Colocasia esculenta TaxID=4460 RepID=A0A843WUT1_COLES|nr:hypothetical protein [Colocasia esculenta]
MDSKCVDTTGHCVDTTGIVFKLGFWDSHLVSTPHGTVSTPEANCNMLLGQRSSVDTTGRCVDTTGRLCRHTGGLCRHHCDKFV